MVCCSPVTTACAAMGWVAWRTATSSHGCHRVAGGRNGWFLLVFNFRSATLRWRRRRLSARLRDQPVCHPARHRHPDVSPWFVFALVLFHSSTPPQRSCGGWPTGARSWRRTPTTCTRCWRSVWCNGWVAAGRNMASAMIVVCPAAAVLAVACWRDTAAMMRFAGPGGRISLSPIWPFAR